MFSRFLSLLKIIQHPSRASLRSGRKTDCGWSFRQLVRAASSPGTHKSNQSTASAGAATAASQAETQTPTFRLVRRLQTRRQQWKTRVRRESGGAAGQSVSQRVGGTTRCPAGIFQQQGCRNNRSTSSAVYQLNPSFRPMSEETDVESATRSMSGCVLTTTRFTWMLHIIVLEATSRTREPSKRLTR